MQIPPVEISKKQPSRTLLGLDHLRRIKTDQLDFYRELQGEYGDVVRLQLGPYRTWLLFHPDPIEEMLTQKWDAFVRFEKLTRVVAQWNGDSLLLAEGEAWRTRRRKVMPAFQTKRLANYGRAAVEQAKTLSHNMDKQTGESGAITIDTDAVMARLTLDIATATLFGAPPMKNGDEIESAIRILSDTAFRESTSPITLPDWLPLKVKKDKKWAMQIMDEMVTGLVAARLQAIKASGEKDRGDLLSMLVEHHQGDAVAIRNDSMSLLIAGHETSGALLSWFFAELAQNDDILNTLIRELDGVLGQRSATYEDLRKLPTIQNAISETLRLHPPAYALFIRRAIRDVSLGPIQMRAGDNVQIVPYTIHRMEKWFENSSSFDPTRFEREPTWPQYAYLPFGAGPRVCIGRSFGLMETCLVAATILQRWRPKEIINKLAPEAKFSLRAKGGLSMLWQPRGAR